MIRSFSLFSRLSALGDIIWKALLHQSTLSLTTRTLFNSPCPKYSCNTNLASQNISCSLMLSFTSTQEDSARDLMCSLDAGTSIPKKGIRASPVSILRTFAWCSRLSNSTLCFMLHTFLKSSMSCKLVHLWTLNNSTTTSYPCYRPTPLCKSTFQTHHTCVGDHHWHNKTSLPWWSHLCP